MKSRLLRTIYVVGAIVSPALPACAGGQTTAPIVLATSLSSVAPESSAAAMFSSTVASALFGALDRQAWGAPGTASFANATTSGTGRTNTLALNPLFTTLLPNLKARTGVPAELPANVIWNSASLGPLYAVLAAATTDGYEINFTSDPGCSFPECENGVLLSGTASGSIDTSNYRTTSTVTLTNGLTATVGIPLYRQPPTITWDQNGRRYLLALPVANFPADLVTMANSMTSY